MAVQEFKAGEKVLVREGATGIWCKGKYVLRNFSSTGRGQHETMTNKPHRVDYTNSEGVEDTDEFADSDVTADTAGAGTKN
ncbi:hypothetical protein BD410DRAFT_783779, partial [Rickenella mellea]